MALNKKKEGTISTLKGTLAGLISLKLIKLVSPKRLLGLSEGLRTYEYPVLTASFSGRNGKYSADNT